MKFSWEGFRERDKRRLWEYSESANGVDENKTLQNLSSKRTLGEIRSVHEGSGVYKNLYLS
jgi:hypothetical protein